MMVITAPTMPSLAHRPTSPRFWERLFLVCEFFTRIHVMKEYSERHLLGEGCQLEEVQKSEKTPKVEIVASAWQTQLCWAVLLTRSLDDTIFHRIT